MAANDGKPPSTQVVPLEDLFDVAVDEEAEAVDLRPFARLLLELAQAKAKTLAGTGDTLTPEERVSPLNS